MSTSYVRNYIFQQAHKKVMSQTQGLYPAPLKILDVCSSSLPSRIRMFVRLGNQTNGRKWFKNWLQCRS